MRFRFAVLATLAALTVVAVPATAQFVLTGPPNGDNQRAAVRQGIGLVDVEVTYSSPDVHAPNGDDRRGKIWGQLVPWGYADLGFGTCGDKCPWRGGANQNTVFRVSHDVVVEGQPLAAGSYGLHFLPGETEWTVIFSKNSEAWGSFSYDEADDALRVRATPKPHEYREWLTYEFPDRGGDHATLELQWEDLALPIHITVPNINELYYVRMKHELENYQGFEFRGWLQGARFLLAHQMHPDVAESWARIAIEPSFRGERNFTTLAVLAEALRANGKADEAKAAFEQAVDHPIATPTDVYQLARPWLGQGRADEALALFQRASDRFHGEWPLEVGVGRAYAQLGDAQHALEHLRQALAQAPDEPNRANLQRLIARLESGDTAIN